jgi:putative membrane protein
MFTDRADSVSNIHKRWSFTRINPSSYKVSYLVYLSSAAAIIALQPSYGIFEDQANFLRALLLGMILLTAAIFVDFFVLLGSPLNKISKVLHVSAFANLLWLLIVSAGALSDMVFSKNGESLNYFFEGMSIATGLRIGIFTSVFGAKVHRAIAASVIQPLIFLFVFENSPFFRHGYVPHTVTIAFGLSLIAIAVIWTIIADRSGRPRVQSTFRLLQAFLAAWTENRTDDMERIAEEKSYDEEISTYIMRLKPEKSKQVSIVLPQVHPGPFSPIGGSNLPYVLYAFYCKAALVLHSVTNHSFNIPSKKELEKYIAAQSKYTTLEIGNTCSIPVGVRVGDCIVTGIAFGKVVIAILSMAPKGMEDVPEVVGREIQQYASQLGIKQVLIVDSHNATGNVLGDYENNNLVSAAKQCLEKLKQAEQFKFKIGYANSDGSYPNRSIAGDLGQGGLAVLIIEVEKKTYALGWADSNNMENGLREHVINELNTKGIKMLEICTSDTHSTSGKRTRQGYYPLGAVSAPSEIANMLFDMSKRSIVSACMSNFELLLAKSKIKVMGKDQFNDYSWALDKSMNITKVFLLITLAVVLSMLIIS